MSDQELLERASMEIKSLRNQLQLANSRLQVYDDMVMLLKTPPVFPMMGGMSPDIAWELDKQISKIKNGENTLAATFDAEVE